MNNVFHTFDTVFHCPVDRKSVEAILCLTEHKAMCYFNQQKTLKALRWYDVLIKIGLRHGSLIDLSNSIT